MGLSIHYSGRIKSKDLTDPLIEEVCEICQELDWKIQVIRSDEIQGVAFGPEDSASLFLTFTPEGRILSPINILAKDIYKDDEKGMFYTASTKTQYAGPEAHIAIIKLLKYISKKYLTEFNVSDESYYWETGDEQLLFEQFKKYDDALNFVTSTMENMPEVPSEPPESLMDRIEKILIEKMNDKNKENRKD